MKTEKIKFEVTRYTVDLTEKEATYLLHLASCGVIDCCCDYYDQVKSFKRELGMQLRKEGARAFIVSETKENIPVAGPGKSPVKSNSSGNKSAKHSKT